MNPDVGMIITNHGWLPIGHDVQSVFAMNHLDVMAAFCQFVRELLNKYGVSAEMVGKIKRGDHAEAHRPSIANLASPSVSPDSGIYTRKRPLLEQEGTVQDAYLLFVVES
jgi:hypothetical protein